LADLLNVKPREIKSFLSGHLAPGRTQELQTELLAAGIPPLAILINVVQIGCFRASAFMFSGHYSYLSFGRPSGSAMPLVWAHAEYLKLRRSLQESRVFDLPPQTVQRYLIEKTGSPRIAWRFNHKIRVMPAGKILRIETMAPAVIHWSVDDWDTVQDVKTRDTGARNAFR
jgi:hypothetical protein